MRRFAGGKRARGPRTRKHALDDLEARLGAGADVAMAERKAVDRRVFEGRKRDGRNDVFGGDPPQCFAERDDFGFGNRRHVRRHQAHGFVEREKRALVREAIVGKLRHQTFSTRSPRRSTGTDSTRSTSTIFSASSSASTGTRDSGTGASEASATIQSSPGCRSGLPTAAR